MNGNDQSVDAATTIVSMPGAYLPARYDSPPVRTASELPERKRTARTRREHGGETIGKILAATHTGILQLANAEIPCANLDDGTRLLTQRGVSAAIGRYRNP